MISDENIKKLQAIVWDEMPDVLTSKDIADAAEISERSARKLMKELGALTVAGKLMVSKEVMKRYFNPTIKD